MQPQFSCTIFGGFFRGGDCVKIDSSIWGKVRPPNRRMGTGNLKKNLPNFLGKNKKMGNFQVTVYWTFLVKCAGTEALENTTVSTVVTV